MKRKFVLICVLIIGILSLLSACDYDKYEKVRPHAFAETIWAAEDGSLTLVISKNEALNNTLIVPDGTAYHVEYLFDGLGSNGVTIMDASTGEHYLYGYCEFSKEQCVIHIEEDKLGVYDEELPTFTLIRRDI